MTRTALLVLVLASTLGTAGTPEDATHENASNLAISAKAGSPESIRQLFALHPRSDGAVTEEIDVVLGSTIRNHPKVFLEELQRSGIATDTGVLPGLLGNTGDELVDRTDAQLAELTARRSALVRVSNKELVPLRDRCLQEMDQLIEQLAKVSRASKP